MISYLPSAATKPRNKCQTSSVLLSTLMGDIFAGRYFSVGQTFLPRKFLQLKHSFYKNIPFGQVQQVLGNGNKRRASTRKTPPVLIEQNYTTV